MELLLNPAPVPRPAPSEWVCRWTALLAPHCTLLDLACGSGRHLAWFAARGHPVTGVDRDLAAAQRLCDDHPAWPVTLVQADIEAQPWPLVQGGVAQAFGAVVVTHYLWRPLLPRICASVRPGGVLLYETFTHGNERLGRPARPQFLLQPGELLQCCADWHIVAYECGRLDHPARCVQRIAAVRPPGNVPGPMGADYPLCR